MNTTTMQQNKTRDIVFIGIFAALIAICSWIFSERRSRGRSSLVKRFIFLSYNLAPSPLTDSEIRKLQTMGVFTAVGLLGGKRGSLAVLVYILLGLVGLPVFAGFSGGVGVLFGTTGGYIIGFLASALLMWGIETVCGRGKIVLAVSMVLGLVVCYAIGTLWFMVVYAKTSGAVGLGTVLGWCVIPFIIPDLIKIGIALLLTERFRKVIA